MGPILRIRQLSAPVCLLYGVILWEIVCCVEHYTGCIEILLVYCTCHCSISRCSHYWMIRSCIRHNYINHFKPSACIESTMELIMVILIEALVMPMSMKSDLLPVLLILKQTVQDSEGAAYVMIVTCNTGQVARWGSVGWPQLGEGVAWVMTVTGNTGQGAWCGSVGWPQVGEGVAWVMTVTGNTGQGARCGSVWWPLDGEWVA